MNMTARRLRSMGWMATLVVCAALVMVLAFRVNALRSQVHQSQTRIISLKQETMYLETEFETRANQQQLKSWNDVDFGYAAPTAAQYLDNERQLASYAKPIEPDAPAPIRVASADDSVDAAAAFPAMVSPMTGKPANDAVPAAAKTRVESDHADSDTASTTAKAGAVTAAVGLAGLSDRLGTVHRADHATSAHKPSTAKDKVAKAKAGAKTSASTTHAISSHDHQPARAKLAKADAHNHPVAGKHTGKPLLTFALKDAKTAK